MKLLPAVAVGVAPADGPTLVNIDTLFWADTPTDRPLGPLTVLGQAVQIRIHVVRMDWEFGDGATGSSPTPGRPYIAGACDTAQCPGFFSHPYTTTGPVTVRATVTWTAQFAVAGGTFEPIPGTVTGPASTHPVTIVQGRSVLVRG